MPRHITADNIRRYALCPCGLYLDHHGPQEERAEAHAFLEHLRDLGIEHEQAVIATLPHLAVPAGSLQFRAQVTLHLLREGHARIYQPVLTAGDLVGIPDFLERVEIPSDLGPFAYRPVDIKISASAKDEHDDQLAFYSLLLGRLQGLSPDTGDVILLDHGRETVELSGQMGRVERIVADVREVMAGRSESPSLSTECGMCPWQEHCLTTLYRTNDVSLLDGFGPARKAVLIDAGYPNLRAVACADADRLCELRGIGQR
ncbi:MAG: TM0106 family RecB-like putative nuclease, partial [Armatimonadota bacterium]